MGVLYSSLPEFTLGIDGIEHIMEHAWDDFRPAAASRDLQNIPSVHITEEHVGAALACPVCKDDFSLGEKVLQLHCSHLFHSVCIVPWLKQRDTCPVCRTALSKHNTNTTGSSSSSSSER